jgi:hypothetical protein
MATVQASRNKLFHSYEKHSAPNKNSKCATTLLHVKYNVTDFQFISDMLSRTPKSASRSNHTNSLKRLLPSLRSETLTQIIKRKITPETKAGQYMCVECGRIFDTKKHVDNHLNIIHNPNRSTVHGKIKLNK